MALRIELTELKRIAGRSEDVNKELNTDLIKMATLLDDICTNVGSSELTGVNKNLVTAINDVAKKVTANLPTVIEFLNKQVANYTQTNDETRESIETLVASIDETLGL